MKMKKATIEYDFQENPSKAIEQNGAKCHIRIQNNQIITEDDICERLQKSSTVTNVDFHAVLSGLEVIITDELARGNVVSLGEICRFEPILGTKEKCKGTEKGDAIQLKTVRVRPSRLLVEQTRERLHPCSRVHAKRSPKIDEEKVLSWLSTYFKTNNFVRRVELEKELGLTRSLASKYLHKLVADGKLLHPGCRNDSLYYPSLDFFH